MAVKDRGATVSVPRPNVCVLSDIEADDYRYRGIKPNCKDHEHISIQDAWDETAPPWMRTNADQHEPLAQWIGPHHIQRCRAFDWKVVHESALDRDDAALHGITGKLRISTLQLVSGAS